MKNKMKALVMRQYGSLSYEDVDIPSVKDGDVLIKVAACAVCGSDISGMNGSMRRIPPVIMGHEASGTVCAVGGNVKNIKVGDRVTTQSTLHCETCDMCIEGKENLCRKREVIGISCEEFRRSGAYAEYVVSPANCVHILPENVSFLKAAMTEPAAIAHHAVSLTPIKECGKYLVLGCGAIGLFAVQILRSMGCSDIIAVDRNPHKLDAALKSGASRVINTREVPSLCAEVGRVNAVIDAMGGEYAFSEGMACLDRGGQFTLVSDPKADVSLTSLIYDELTVRGSSNSLPKDFTSALEMISDGRINTDIVISETVPLKDGNEWFCALARKEKKVIKIVLIP